MNSLAKTIKSTVWGGIFFLVPVVLFVWIISRALGVIRQVFRPVLIMLPETRLAGVVGIRQLVAIVVLLVICLIAGLLARTRMANRFLNWLEDNILGLVPGYRVLKNMGEHISGLEAQDLKVVLARVDDGWQLSFLIDKIAEDMYTVFVPGSPEPWSGSVYHMEGNKIIWTDITKKQALRCLRQMGFGSADMLKDRFGVSGPLQA
jgi:uncharacterized membrane protein